MRKKELCCDQRCYIHIHVYIMSLATSQMIALLATYKFLNKRRIKGLVYRTRSSVIFIGPRLLGFINRGLSVYNVFGCFPHHLRLLMCPYQKKAWLNCECPARERYRAPRCHFKFSRIFSPTSLLCHEKMKWRHLAALKIRQMAFAHQIPTIYFREMGQN